MLNFEPPLLNSANVWASTPEELRALYECPHTGAITIRTSLLRGFKHDDDLHQYCFFSDNDGPDQKRINLSQDGLEVKSVSSLNTLGYSPIPFFEYVNIITKLEADRHSSGVPGKPKPVIFSVTGSETSIQRCYQLLLRTHQTKMSHPTGSWLMEINLSCPNIVGKPPPAYSRKGLTSYLSALEEVMTAPSPVEGRLPVGIKLPPFTYEKQFDALIEALRTTIGEAGVDGNWRVGRQCPISFITATNTLGSCLVMGSDFAPAINSANGEGIGGLAGAALHPLALGNVRTIRKMLDKENELLRQIEIIGVGGVSDGAGYRRMRAAGASVVAMATALGSEGVGVFERIMGEIREMEGKERI
ncbi:dihydroorotate dehydrogenase [Bachmanniomyces sp. S44760]|nr:dihydroorotate dehydrogenase [Bachmanniomyces sp. S44760]